MIWWGCVMVVVVGTWNLENLYRPGGPFGPKTQEAYEAKLATLAATITGLAPDVLAVQEVGQPAALDDLVARLPGPWTVTLSEHPDPRGIRVGFLTRTPPAAVGADRRLPAVAAADPGRRRPRPTPARRWAAAACTSRHRPGRYPVGPASRCI